MSGMSEKCEIVKAFLEGAGIIKDNISPPPAKTAAGPRERAFFLTCVAHGDALRDEHASRNARNAQHLLQLNDYVGAAREAGRIYRGEREFDAIRVVESLNLLLKLGTPTILFGN